MLIVKLSFIWIFIGVICLQAQWQYGPSMPTARYGMAVAVMNDQIYIIGGTQAGRNGLTAVERFDTVDEAWVKNLSDINQARIYAAAVVFEDKIYLFGGINRNELIAQVEVYDPDSDHWHIITDMPAPREGCCAVVVDSCVWIIGGSSVKQERPTAIERYYPHSNRWDTLAYPLNTGRVGAVAGAYKNEVYVFGGHFVEPLSSYEKFIPGQGWQQAGKMLYACGSASAVFSDKKIWIAGGQGDARILSNVQSLQIDSVSQWQEEVPLQTGRKNLVLAGAANRLYAIGGAAADNAQAASDILEVFDLMTKISVEGPPPVADRLQLRQNYPNPFNSTTLIRVYAPVTTPIRISIYNILGEQVRHLYTGCFKGWQQFTFNAQDDLGKTIPSGQYFVYLTTPYEKRVQKIVFAK